MGKINRAIAILIIIVLLSGCSKKQTHDEFFAWMDAYIAVEKDTKSSIAITLFFEKEPFNKEEIIDISFIGIDKEIGINSFNVEGSEKNSKKYSSYGIILDFIANETGIYETSGVEVTFRSNKSVEYPIGSWKFDVGEKSAEVVDTWSSPVVSTNSREFPYDYKIIEPEADIKRIFYGEDAYISSNIGNQGIIDIDNYASPIVYIRSKIITTVKDLEKVDYGKGCYCGAIGFSEDVLTVSKEHNSIR